MNNPALQERLLKYLRERCKRAIDENALDLINEIERPAIICEGSWHAEYLLRRDAPHHVDYLSHELKWEALGDHESVTQLILSGYLYRFYGPLQTQKYMVPSGWEYIVYNHSINGSTTQKEVSK